MIQGKAENRKKTIEIKKLQLQNLKDQVNSPEERMLDFNQLTSKELRKNQSLSVRNTPQLYSQNKQRQKTAATSTDNILKKLSSKELSQHAEQLQSGYCKLIVLPNQKPEDIGFKTFSELMMSNVSWTHRAQQMQPLKSETTQSPEIISNNSSTQFPSYLSSRLEFNQTQVKLFSTQMEGKWLKSLDDIQQKYTTKQKESYRTPKVRVILNDKKIKTEEEKDKVKLIISYQIQEIGEQEEEGSAIQQDQNNLKLRNLKFFWYQIQIIEQWKPAMREGASLIYIPNSNRCIMYGGIGRELFNNVVILNTKSWIWENVGPGSGDAPQTGRFGHSATQFKNVVIIFGGERKFNTSMKMRECYGDVRLYSPQEHSWQYVRTYGDLAEARRNHCGVVAGKFFFVFGGISSFGKYLNDLVALNMDSLKWSVRNIIIIIHNRTSLTIENFYEQGIAFATTLAFYKSDIKVDNPYFNYELIKKKGKRLLKLAEEGIYIFGGRLGNGEATNEIRVIKIGSKPLICKKLETKVFALIYEILKGIGPTPRYMHSMNYYEEMNLTIIYGGRDDSQYSKSQSSIKNDIFVLDMETLHWVGVQHIGQNLYGKCSHSTALLGSKMLIFGGYSDKSFVNSDLHFIEFDQSKTRMMLKESKNRYGGVRGKFDINQQFILSREDLKNDITLKIFTMDNVNIQGNQLDDEELQMKLQKEREIDKLSVKNFRSFLPQPLSETSHLIKEFRMKRDQERQDGQAQPQPQPQPQLQSGNGSRLNMKIDELKINPIATQQQLQRKQSAVVKGDQNRFSLVTYLQKATLQPVKEEETV